MLLKYFASIYPLGASVLKHLIFILECPTSGHLTQFLNFLSNPHPLPAPLPPGINIDRCIKLDENAPRERLEHGNSLQHLCQIIGTIKKSATILGFDLNKLAIWFHNF
jgi:hypothetical protein